MSKLKIKSKCPPNTICVNKTFLAIITISLLLLALCYQTYTSYTHKQANANVNVHAHMTTIDKINPPNTLHISNIRQSDHYDVFQPPVKPMWTNGIKSISTNYSRPDYKQIGILTRESAQDNARERETILALFGRPIHNGRSKWQYYTMTDKSSSIKLPITINGKSGSTTYGVDEIYSGDNVHVQGYNETFQVTLYEQQQFEY